jgi:hypothetical protein
MADADRITYTFKELAEILVKEQNIHAGLWGLYVRFGIRALNTGESDTDLKPTALVPILDIGLQKFEDLNNLSVDAAVVNPPSRSRTRRMQSAKRAKK